MADYRLFIDGEFRDAASGETFQTLDPSTGESLGTVARAGREDAQAAIAAARAAFDDGRWSGRTGAERGAVLRAAADLIAAQAGELAELERRDSGSTLVKAMAADVGGAIQWFSACADMAATLDEPETLPPSPFGSANTLRRDPVGVCSAIVPWNFPLQMAAWKLAPALAAGNTVVLKPAEETPCTAVRLAEILREAGVPDGVVNVIPGPGPGTGEELASNPDVDKVAFTGSTNVGREIMRMASPTLKKVTLELGGKSAQIVLDDADLDLAVDGALYAVFLHSGQACTAGSRLLLPDALHDEFVGRLLERASAIRVGPTADPSNQLGPLVSQKQLDTVLHYIDIGGKEGATLALGGSRLTDGELAQGFFVEPTVFTDVRADMTIAQEEIFGPVLSVLRYRDEDEAVAIANGTAYGLAAGVWGSPARATALAGRLRAGTVWVNEWHLLNPHYPFGGYGQSGIGREHGLLGLHEWTEAKHVHAASDTSRAAHRWFDMVVPGSTA
ncbi:MAG TPA: aldehyde dehydrogenase family protein [Egibacteraceae bacterium]|nr:aldehyde dehydrogenase family protein [Egibacteraceae bacterium]